MDNTPDFKFNGTVLEQYTGPGGYVVIPEGVTAIGPKAFYKCSALTAVIIPGTVTSIGNSAFHWCDQLRSVTIPEGVTTIGNDAFHWCKALTSVTIPGSVTSVGSDAFSGCGNLTAAAMSKTVFDLWRWSKAYSLSFGIAVRDGDRWEFYAYSTTTFSANRFDDNLKDFVRACRWNDYDGELINNGPAYKYKIPAKLLGCLGRLENPAELSEESRNAHLEYLIKNAKKLIPIADELRCPAIVEAMLRLGVINGQNRKAVMKLIAAASAPEIAALADSVSLPPARAAKAAPKAVPAVPAAAAEPDLAEVYGKKWTQIKGSSILKNMKLLGVTMPEVKLRDGSPAPRDLFRFILVSYGRQTGKQLALDPEADEAAALLAYDSLCDAMDAVSGNLNGPAYPSVLPMLCRYGSPSQIKQLVSSYRDWGEWSKFGTKGRTAQRVLEQAMVLSETRAAVVFLEQQRLLDTYAAFRGITGEEVYEKYLFDFGFDENGVRTLDLGITTVEVTLTPEITLEMINTATGKPVKSIPKAKTDPAVYKKAVNDLDDMRQNLQKAISIKKRQLWNDYLEGTGIPVETWKQRYLVNPFQNRIARIVVWEQDGNTFLLTSGGTIDSAGNPCELTTGPIRLAHPMEMDAENVTAWQRYFTAHGLKQPFLQIWEPVYLEKDIRPDRYKDCRIKAVYLKKQEHRGIRIQWNPASYYGERQLDIQGFELCVEEMDDDLSLLEIASIQPNVWNRRANMIIGHLDRLTLYGRIKKDDQSVIEQMDGITLAQIVDYIDLAQTSGAVNVTALLMELKNTRFGDFNPMDEFTLDW